MNRVRAERTRAGTNAPGVRPFRRFRHPRCGPPRHPPAPSTPALPDSKGLLAGSVEPETTGSTWRPHHRGRPLPVPVALRATSASHPERVDDHAPLLDGTARPPAPAGTAQVGRTIWLANAPPGAPIGQEPRRMGAHRDRPHACQGIRRCVTPGQRAHVSVPGTAGIITQPVCCAAWCPRPSWRGAWGPSAPGKSRPASGATHPARGHPPARTHLEAA